MMTPMAAYDEIADWYETEFLGRAPDDHGELTDGLGITRALRELLGPGEGLCLEIGCGTGVHAATVRDLGRTPIGIDLSAGMLDYAVPRLPVGVGDAARLPVADQAVSAVASVMIHTDLPDYPAVLREAARVLRPGGRFVHVGVHPCFCGGFADRSDREAVVIGPGYADGAWTKNSWSEEGIRSRIGARHLPLAGLMNAAAEAGLRMERMIESGGATPAVLAFSALRA